MAKVAPDGGWYQSKAFPEGKVIKTTPPLAALDPKYVARKNAFTRGAVQLRSGRRLAYLEEGDKDAPVQMLAFHGAMSGKEAWITPEPLEGARVVLVDRAGNGDSSLVKWQEYDIVAERADIVELVAELFGAKEFAVIGFSSGGSLALRTAAALGSRVVACGAVGANADMMHSRVTPEQRKACTHKMVTSLFNGCCGGAVMRALVGAAMGNMRAIDHPQIWDSLFKMMKDEKTTEKRLGEIQADTFFASAWLDGAHCGYHNADSMWVDAKQRTVSWEEAGMDLTKISCPTVLYAGRKDPTAPAAAGELNKELIPTARITWFEEDAHASLAQHQLACLNEVIQEAREKG